MQLQKKKKILFIGDHPLSTSGVGVQSRMLLNGLLATGKYSINALGAALKHTSYDTIEVNPDFVIKPIDGFGDKNLIRMCLVQEKPDAIILFTDPRFFPHVWTAEDEIHGICPIVYNTIWDNNPVPTFNRPIYESCDLLNCINDVAYQACKSMFPERTNYIPHAVPKDMYFPLSDDAIKQARRNFLKDKADDFIVLFVGRNAKRKMTADIMFAWRDFLQELKQKHGHTKATLLMHTDPFDHEGPNLHAILELLGISDNVIFSKDRTGFLEMNTLYNMCDTLVNASSAEGFGLPVLEAKMCAKPVIAVKTGGLTKQVVDDVTGKEYGVAMTPDARSIVGTQGQVHWIYEDIVSHKTLTASYMKMYEMGHDVRKQLGLDAMEHARTNYDVDNLIKRWDETLTDTIENWRSRYKRWEHIEM